METVLYIAAVLALVTLIWVLLRAGRTLSDVSTVLTHTDSMLDDVRRSASQISADVTAIRIHAAPALDSLSEVAGRVSEITEGLAPRVEAMYETIDDALDVAHGILDDVERLKSEVVDTIEPPLRAVRTTTNGIGTTIVKGLGLVKDLVAEFKKK